MQGKPNRMSDRGFCVIMAGGRGTRFWPLSRRLRPKQLLPLGSDRSLLRDTFDRVAPLVGADRILVVTNADQAAATAAELPELSADRIIAEPVGRNTAPCAVLGIGLAAGIGGEGPVALLPADHWIPDAEAFRRQLAAAFDHAGSTGDTVTFGIPPTGPATGYGYLEIAPDSRVEMQVPGTGMRFVEKPDHDTAAGYLESGRFLWNSGIFVWHSRTFAAAAAAHLPESASRMSVPIAAHGADGFPAALAAAYADCPAVSIDVGVMEKLQSFAVLRAEFAWSDLGSWDAWAEVAPDLGSGNRGRADLIQIDSRGNVVHAPGKTVALLGVEDLVVVDTDDALLVCRTADAQRVREIIADIEKRNREDLL